MKFHTTLRIEKNNLTVADADEVTEVIRERGYPGDGWTREGDHLKWECEFQGESLTEIADRYNETRDTVRSTSGFYANLWTADPDDPVEVATRAARDVLDWEKHFDGISLPNELREALERVAGEDWTP